MHALAVFLLTYTSVFGVGLLLGIAYARPFTARAALALLDNFFADRFVTREERQKLWDVLSAMRGPDSPSYGSTSAKAATTAVIRYNAFPKASARYRIPAMVLTDEGYYVETRINENIASTCGYHFESHAESAFQALNLSWNSQNNRSRR